MRMDVCICVWMCVYEYECVYMRNSMRVKNYIY